MASQRFHPYTKPSAPARLTISMFSNAQGVAFHGNPTFHLTDSASRIPGPTEESLEKGMDILRQRVAVGAMHNSGEQFDSPKCHPGTRIALQDDVSRWVDESPGGRIVTWLFGPAGAGKSAIAQTISEKLHAQGKLTASFFFSRKESASKGRGDESAVIATLALQISLSVPATKPLIARAVHYNPVIFDLSLDNQVQALIVHPLTAVLQENPEYGYPRVIVVDGLDECRKEDNAQSRVVSALINGLSSIPQRGQKLFITSRPEHNIAAIFRSFKPELLRTMELNDKWKPDADIRAFLHAAFAEIRSSHPYFETHPPDHMWPCHADIEKLISRSSGQFIYASVVTKYIRSEDYYDPAARLQVILQLKNNEDQPYAELDALYKYIFSQIRDVDKVLTVLSLERMYSENKILIPARLDLILPDLIGTCMEEIKFCFRPLVSLLVWEGDMIRYMHASLVDFLLDPTRSNCFCINSLSVASKVVRRALDLMESERLFMDCDFLLLLLRIPLHYTKKLLPHDTTHIYSMISGFSFVKNVFYQLANPTVGNFKLSHFTTSTIGSYLERTLMQSKSNNALEYWNALAGPPSEIQTWLMRHCDLANECFGVLNNADQLDLWPFLPIPFDYTYYTNIRQQISDHIASAVGICRPATLSSQDRDVQPSNQTVIFYCLLPHIPSWLASTELLGKYAITRERYAVAFLHTLRFLLRLPVVQFTQVLTEALPNKDKWSGSMHLARQAFSRMLHLIPSREDLYFLVLFLCYAINGDSQRKDHSSRQSLFRRPQHTPVSDAIGYLSKMQKEFPLLNNSTSPEYISARANAKTTWVGFERDSHDPVPLVLPHDLKQKRKRWVATQIRLYDIKTAAYGSSFDHHTNVNRRSQHD